MANNKHNWHNQGQLTKAFSNECYSSWFNLKIWLKVGEYYHTFCNWQSFLNLSNLYKVKIYRPPKNIDHPKGILALITCSSNI